MYVAKHCKDYVILLSKQLSEHACVQSHGLPQTKFESSSSTSFEEVENKSISSICTAMHDVNYRRWGKICWTKYSRFQCHQSFCGNIFTLPWP